MCSSDFESAWRKVSVRDVCLILPVSYLRKGLLSGESVLSDLIRCSKILNLETSNGGWDILQWEWKQIGFNLQRIALPVCGEYYHLISCPFCNLLQGLIEAGSSLDGTSPAALSSISFHIRTVCHASVFPLVVGRIERWGRRWTPPGIS